MWLAEPGHEGLFSFRPDVPAGLANLSLAKGQSIVIPVVSGGGAWVRLTSGEIRPEWYGAGGSGDDTRALQQALDALGVRGSRLVLAGEYRISARLVLVNRSNFAIAGPGRISASSAMPVASDKQCLLLVGCSDFTISDLAIDAHPERRAAAVTAAHAVEVRSCSRFAFQGVSVTNSPADCLYIAAAARDARNAGMHTSDGLFKGCTFAGGFRQGVSIIQGRGIRFEDCRFTGASGAAPQAGVDLESNPPDLDGAIEDIAFTGCVFEANDGFGLLVASAHTPRRITVRNCTFRGNAAGAISWQGRDGLVEDCVFDGTVAVRGCIDIGASKSAGWLDVVRPRILNASGASPFVYVHRLAGGSVRLIDTVGTQIGLVANFRAPNCTISGGAFEQTREGAVALSGTGCAVTDATFSKFGGTVITIGAQGCSVTGCVFDDPAQASPQGVVRALPATRATIRGNRFSGLGARGHAITAPAAAEAIIESNTVE
ncbi:MAG: right-handed parallel beta-helix repeat-containing protein [Tsuneonella sp.]